MFYPNGPRGTTRPLSRLTTRCALSTLLGMNEHEKTIRDCANAFRYSALKTQNARDAKDIDDLERALDALLAGHRAEVEALTEEKAEAERFRDSWRRRWSEEVGVARGAALEEAARDVDVVAVAGGIPAVRAAASACAESIRALKSSPATVVSVEKVREVLADVDRLAFNKSDQTSDGYAFWQEVKWALGEVRMRLGVDLDAGPRP